MDWLQLKQVRPRQLLEHTCRHLRVPHAQFFEFAADIVLSLREKYAMSAPMEKQLLFIVLAL